jgi:hypothetical protein
MRTITASVDMSVKPGDRVRMCITPFEESTFVVRSARNRVISFRELRWHERIIDWYLWPRLPRVKRLDLRSPTRHYITLGRCECNICQHLRETSDAKE